MTISLPKRRRIYLMRHGEVEYFAEGKAFRPDEVPLTSNGEKQAIAAGELLRHVKIDRALVSPLLRTMQTARHVLAGRDVPIVNYDELREIAPGKLRDLPPDPMTIFQTFVNAFGSTITEEDQFLGGETFGSMIKRVNGIIDRTLSDETWSDLLVVAHGGVNRAWLTRALGTGLHGFGRFEQDPACINIIDVDERGRLLVRMLNFSPTNAAKLGHRLTTMEELFAHYAGIKTDGDQ